MRCKQAFGFYFVNSSLGLLSTREIVPMNTIIIYFHLYCIRVASAIAEEMKVSAWLDTTREGKNVISSLLFFQSQTVGAAGGP